MDAASLEVVVERRRTPLVIILMGKTKDLTCVVYRLLQHIINCQQLTSSGELFGKQLYDTITKVSYTKTRIIGVKKNKLSCATASLITQLRSLYESMTMLRSCNENCMICA